MKLKKFFLRPIVSFKKTKPEIIFFASKNITRVFWYWSLFLILRRSYTWYTNVSINWSWLEYSYTNFLNNSNTLNNYKSFHKLKTNLKTPTTPTSYDKLDQQVNFNLIKVFKIFVQIILSHSTIVFKVHASWKTFFIDHGSNIRYLLLRNLFNKFKHLIYFLNTVYFFNLKILYFSNSFFRSEVNSLNWLKLKNVAHMWRYISPFFTLKPSRIFDKAWIIFYKLRLDGYYIALITDLRYHIKNLYYLNRSRYYTIGFVPLWYNSNLVSFAIPIPNDSTTSQLFIFRFVLIIMKSVKRRKFKNNVSMWLDFKKKFK